MPLMNGLEFLEALKNIESLEKRPEVIMVTAANAADTVCKLMGVGIRDYLIKPFEYTRFEQALLMFEEYRELLGKSRDQLSQKEIDRMLHGKNRKESGPDHFFTSEEIAEQVHLSRVTIRRYVNYMLEREEIISEVNYQTGGRPSIRYRYARM